MKSPTGSVASSSFTACVILLSVSCAMKSNNWKRRNELSKINWNRPSTIFSFAFEFVALPSRHAWNILQQQLHRIEDEIAVKSNSIMLENRALETRRRLNTEITPSTQTDRNRQLLNMDTSGLRPVLQSIYWDELKHRSLLLFLLDSLNVCLHILFYASNHQLSEKTARWAETGLRLLPFILYWKTSIVEIVDWKTFNDLLEYSTSH